MKKYSVLLALLVFGCSLAPDLVVPQTNTPSKFKEQQPEAVTPTEKNWWEVFGNDDLNKYIAKATSSNLNIKIAAERLNQARASAGINESALYPTADATLSADRTKNSGNLGGPNSGKITNDYKVNAIVSYEPDLLGKNYNRFLSALYTSEEEEFNFKAATLTLQAEVAIYYNTIAALDAELELLEKASKLSTETADIASKRLEIGAIDKAQYAAIKQQTNAIDINILEAKDLRKNLANAFAVLLGENPTSFNLPNLKVVEAKQIIPVGLPSDVLKRRPDVQAAIKNLESGNQLIGAARAAFFPNITLSISGGGESNELSDVLKPSSRIWSLGFAQIDVPIFSAGRASSNLDLTKSKFTEAELEYQSKVIGAFQDVENAISAVNTSGAALKIATESSDLGKNAYDIATKRYDAGYSSYLDLLLAENNYIASQRAAINQQNKQFAATVTLIKAIGGGWN